MRKWVCKTCGKRGVCLDAAKTELIVDIVKAMDNGYFEVFYCMSEGHHTKISRMTIKEKAIYLLEK